MLESRFERSSSGAGVDPTPVQLAQRWRFQPAAGINQLLPLIENIKFSR